MIDLKRRKRSGKNRQVYKTAWNPDHLRFIAVFCSMLPGAVVYCLNYKKLEYPEKKKKILTILGVTTVLFLFAFIAPTNKFFYILLYMINLLVSMYFAYDQKPIYEDFLKNGGYRATVVKPVLLSVLAVALFFIIVAVVI